VVWAIAEEGVELVARKVLAAGNSSGIDVRRTGEAAVTLDPSNPVVEESEEVEVEAEAPVGKTAVAGKGGRLGILVVDSHEVVESMGC